MKKQKGEYGYRSYYKWKMGIIIAFFILAILVQYIASRMTQSVGARNILTVMAVLTVLPMANLAAPFLSVFRFRTPSESQKRRVDAFSDRGCMLYDLVITFREVILPVDFLLVRDGHALLYVSKKKVDRSKSVELIEGNLRQNHTSCKVSLYDDFEKFLQALEKCSVQEGNRTVAESTCRVLKSLSV